MSEKPKELKEHSAQIFELGCMERPVYLKEDVDAVIAELKQKLQDQCISCPVKMQEDDVVAELKQNLEDAKATAYAESVDAGMRERRLKRALWLARERTAIEKHNHFALCHNHSSHHKYKRCLAMAKWCEAEMCNILNTPLCDMNTHEVWQHDDEFWRRWCERWLELAERFK